MHKKIIVFFTAGKKVVYFYKLYNYLSPKLLRLAKAVVFNFPIHHILPLQSPMMGHDGRYDAMLIGEKFYFRKMVGSSPHNVGGISYINHQGEQRWAGADNFLFYRPEAYPYYFEQLNYKYQGNNETVWIDH